MSFLKVYTILIIMVIVVAAIAIIQGCAILPQRPSICDNLTEPSYLCQMAHDQGVRLEDVGNILIVVNSVSISTGLYTRDQANYVLGILRGILAEDISYAGFATKLLGEIKVEPGLIQVADSYINYFQEIYLPITSFDRKVLIEFIDKQIQ